MEHVPNKTNVRIFFDAELPCSLVRAAGLLYERVKGFFTKGVHCVRVFILMGLFLQFFLSNNLSASTNNTKFYLSSLKSIVADTEYNYAMIPLKKALSIADLSEVSKRYENYMESALLPEEAKKLVPAKDREALSFKEAQQVMIGFAAEFQDGHFNIIRPSNDLLTLGIYGGAIDGKLYVTGLDRTLVTKDVAELNIEAGDEILFLNGKSVQDLAASLTVYSQTGTPEAIYSQALQSVINVDGRFYLTPEEGSTVEVTFRKQNGRVYSGLFHWVNRARINEIIDQSQLLEPQTAPQSNKAEFYYGQRSNSSHLQKGIESLGLPEGSVWDLGDSLNRELDETQRVNRISVKLVRFNEKNIGVLRIPSYDGSVEKTELAWLEKMISRLNVFTDILVIDHLANGGGSNFYSSQFLRFFADKPMKGLSANLKLSHQFFHSENDWEDQTFRDNYPENVAMQVRRDKWKNELDKGNPWVRGVGVHDSQMAYRDDRPYGCILAKPGAVYTKPVLLLNDRMSASNGDMVPSILQMNKRATIMGERSSGLGGFVYLIKQAQTPLELTLRSTFAEAYRPDGTPIEGVGTIPDVLRPVVADDLANGFSTYAKDVINTACAILNDETDLESGLTTAEFTKAQKRVAENARKEIFKKFPKIKNDYLLHVALTSREFKMRLNQLLNSKQVNGLNCMSWLSKPL